jgi:hypothetical protein
MTSGDAREVEQHLTEAIQVAWRGGFHANVLDALVSLATARAKAGDTTSALEMVTLVLQDPATKHPSQIRAEQLCAELATRLTPQQFEEAEAQAHSQPFDQTIGEILWKESEF